MVRFCFACFRLSMRHDFCFAFLIFFLGYCACIKQVFDFYQFVAHHVKRFVFLFFQGNTLLLVYHIYIFSSTSKSNISQNRIKNLAIEIEFCL